MTVRVELQPMMVKKHTALGVFEEPVGQNIVLAATGSKDPLVRVAYICDAHGSPFNGLPEFRALPQQIKEQIVEATMQALGRPQESPNVVEPIPMTAEMAAVAAEIRGE